MLEIQAIPAFVDNYIWCLHDAGKAFLVDPGDAAPALSFLRQRHLDLAGLLITHHHGDHTGGVNALLSAFPQAVVYGPRNPAIPGINRPLREGDHIDLFGLRWQVLAVPGHTLDHIAYFCPGQEPPLLFCGDTLFAAGCGRLFEGSPAQMFASLQKLAGLPGNTAVYCTHEYTQSNLRFARAAEPENPALRQRAERVDEQRQRGEITLPSSVALELETNPFLRCHTPALQRSARDHAADAHSPEQVFAALRAWKDRF